MTIEYRIIHMVGHTSILEAFRNGNVIGRTGYTKTKDNRAYLNIPNDVFDIEVFGSRHQGIGKGLLKKVIESLNEEKIKNLDIIYVVPKAIPFYEKSFKDFKKEGIIHKFQSEIKYNQHNPSHACPRDYMVALQGGKE